MGRSTYVFCKLLCDNKTLRHNLRVICKVLHENFENKTFIPQAEIYKIKIMGLLYIYITLVISDLKMQ